MVGSFYYVFGLLYVLYDFASLWRYIRFYLLLRASDFLWAFADIFRFIGIFTLFNVIFTFICFYEPSDFLWAFGNF